MLEFCASSTSVGVSGGEEFRIGRLEPLNSLPHVSFAHEKVPVCALSLSLSLFLSLLFLPWDTTRFRTWAESCRETFDTLCVSTEDTRKARWKETYVALTNDRRWPCNFRKEKKEKEELFHQGFVESSFSGCFRRNRSIGVIGKLISPFGIWGLDGEVELVGMWSNCCDYLVILEKVQPVNRANFKSELLHQNSNVRISNVRIY